MIEQNSSAPNRLVDVNDLAQYLGVPTSWVYDRTSADPQRIPHFKIGKYLRFDVKSEEFKTWLNRNFRN